MTGSWWTASASAIGSSHASSGAPNQDAVVVFETDRGVVAAVADGHGGARYVRSAIGSNTAVEVARVLGAEALDAPGTLLSVAGQLPDRIVGEWRRAVSEHLAANPLTPDESAAVGADPIVAYGATLMMVLFRRDEVVGVQLGDGDIVAAWNDGRAIRAVPDDPRNVGGRTTSLCLDDAVPSFRVAAIDDGGRTPHLVLVSTDGYGNSFADREWYRQVTNDLFQQVRAHGPSAVSAGLPAWIAESARVGGDDTTVVLVGTPEAAATPTLPPPVSRAGSAVAATRRGWSNGVVAALAAGGLLVGLLIGWLLGAGNDEPAAATVSTAQPSTTAIAETTVVGTTETTTNTTTSTTTGIVPPPDADRSVRFAAGPVLVIVDDVTDRSSSVSAEPLPEGARAEPSPVWTEAGEWSIVSGALVLRTIDGESRPWDGSSSPALEAVGLGTNAGRVVVAYYDTFSPGSLTLRVLNGLTGMSMWDSEVLLPAEQQQESVATSIGATPIAPDGTNTGGTT